MVKVSTAIPSKLHLKSSSCRVISKSLKNSVCGFPARHLSERSAARLRNFSSCFGIFLFQLHYCNKSIISIFQSHLRYHFTKFVLRRIFHSKFPPLLFSDYDWTDMVTFYIGCSFSFDGMLLAHSIPIRNCEQKKAISMYMVSDFIPGRVIRRLHHPKFHDLLCLFV